MRTIEFFEQHQLWHAAWHEAGHALFAFHNNMLKEDCLIGIAMHDRPTGVLRGIVPNPSFDWLKENDLLDIIKQGLTSPMKNWERQIEQTLNHAGRLTSDLVMEIIREEKNILLEYHLAHDALERSAMLCLSGSAAEEIFCDQCEALTLKGSESDLHKFLDILYCLDDRQTAVDARTRYYSSLIEITFLEPLNRAALKAVASYLFENGSIFGLENLEQIINDAEARFHQENRLLTRYNNRDRTSGESNKGNWPSS